MTTPSSVRAAAAPATGLGAAACQDVGCRDSRGVDAETYHYLEQLWTAAIQRAEASTSGIAGDTPLLASSSVAAPHGWEPSAVGTTSFDRASSRVLHAPHPAPAPGVTASPLPCAPHVQASTRLPPAAALRRPVSVAARQPQERMRVEAQPNLKRNAYTAHRGVAWVVQ